jgi:S1-C subfamily serine protease
MPRKPLVVRAQQEQKTRARDDEAQAPPLRSRLGAAAAAGLVFLSGVGVGAGGAVALSAPPAPVTQQQQTTTTTAPASTLFAPAKPAPSLSLPPPSPSASADAAAAAARRKGLSPEEQATIRIFEETTPAVVNITNLQRVRLSGGGGGLGGFYGSGGFSSSPSGGAALAPVGTGSGFLWPAPGNRPGVVVTNFHVVRGAAALKVTLYDQTTYDAKVLGADPEKDTAVLQLQGVPPGKSLQPVSLGSSSDLQVGQRVYALGNPFGLDHSLSSGIVSGLNREIGESVGGVPLRGVIQTDASINPGNSGGVLLASDGKVIGINTAIADPTGKGSSSGVGFALPIDAIKGLVAQILEYGRVVRPALGISIAPPQALRQLGLEGVLILDAPADGPAAKAGLRATTRDPETGAVRLGDVIIALDGQSVKNFGDLYKVLDERRVGDEVKVEVLRDVHVEAVNGGATGVVKGARGAVTVRLGERATAGAAAAAAAAE